MRQSIAGIALALVMVAAGAAPHAEYVNFESSHVHPIVLTPQGGRLLAVNTPDALLEVFSVGPAGDLTPLPPIPVGLEPVSVVARTETEAWVVNHLSDTISIVDLVLGTTIRTLPTGDEPTDVVFARGRAYVSVSQEDGVRVFELANLALPPAFIKLSGRSTRALAVANDGSKVYAVVQNSGNQTTVVNANIIAGNDPGLNLTRLSALGLNTTQCNGAPPPYPPLPAGIVRNPALTDPAPPAQPPVGLIVKWDPAASRWRDEAGQDWSHCLPFRLPDHDLAVIDANTPADPGSLSYVDHLGTTLFEVSVNPATGRIYVPNTDAGNNIRFEHPLGVTGRVVRNQLSVVDPVSSAVTRIDLNSHINPASDPATNLAEREASISQPGMMAWNAAGTRAWLTAIGSRKLFKLDAACGSGSCIFGPLRAAPDAVEVGEGPTGIALNESADRAYVLNRFANSIAIVRASTMTMLGSIPLHDPSSAIVKNGRRFLYDGIISSRHGDAACSSCHISGDRDELAWDLGDPTGDFAAYGTPGDNVRFIIPAGGVPVEVTAAPPASAHLGFDPQKGPMTTQTLRGMLEPLHWRGDRGTMNAFNKAFVGLLGAHDVGPVNGEPAGLSADEMELYRRFALDIQFPPNPYRSLDDVEPNAQVTLPGNPFTGNPAAGRSLFLTGRVDANQPCSACHALPFGAAGGQLGGVSPSDPSAARAALFNGDADGSPHSDLKVPHLRNMLEKVGPRFGLATDPNDRPDAASGFGFIHDGSVPDLGTFLSASVFALTPQQVRDLSVFMFLFPTGQKPSVGRQLTLPAGPPPTGTPAQESVLSALLGLGNAADPTHHCELTVSARDAGRERTWFLDGGLSTGGLFTTDVNGEPQVSTAALRAGADGPLTFLCATIGSGLRLGADRDQDTLLNGTDCNDGDPAWGAAPVEVANVTAHATGARLLTWDDQSAQVGPSLFHEVAGGMLRELGQSGLGVATRCLASGLTTAGWDDPRPDPPRGDGYYYLVRARTPECSGGFGTGAGAVEQLSCTGF